MKNTIKYISRMVLGLGLAVVSLQAQASAGPVQTVPFFTPITLSGTAATGVTTVTNGTNYVYSKVTGTFNNAFILSEFYASDDAKGLSWETAVSAAKGDTLVVCVAEPYTNYTPAVYATLPGGQTVVVTNAIYGWAIDPFTGYTVQNGDFVILDAKGNIKADLTRADLADNWWDGEDWAWDYTSYGRNGVNTYNFLIHSALNFYFNFGSDADFIRVQSWGGGSDTYNNNGVKPPVIGGMAFSGSVEVYIANPANQVPTTEGVSCDQWFYGPASYNMSSWIVWWGD